MKRFKEFLAEAGLKKALKTKKQKLLKKEEQKAEARWERTMGKATSADVAGTMQEYGASSPEAGRAKLKSDLAHESAGKLASNIEKLKKARKESNVSENYDPYLDLPKKKSQEENDKLEKNTPNDKWGEQLTFGEVGRQGLDGSNVGFENAYGLGNIMYATPKNKQRIQAEKNLNTDVGMAFDVDEYGEPVGDLAGFKAVAKRAEEGRSQPTAYPPKTFDEYSSEWRDNAIQAAKDMLEPETYQKLLKVIQQGLR